MIENIEYTINILGKKLSDNLNETDIEKTLGVLAGDGVFAMKVYIESKKTNAKFKDSYIKIFNLLEIPGNDNDLDNKFETLSKDLMKLLYFKELMEKALIYARYHSKAKSPNKTV